MGLLDKFKKKRIEEDFPEPEPLPEPEPEPLPEVESQYAPQQYAPDIQLQQQPQQQYTPQNAQYASAPQVDSNALKNQLEVINSKIDMLRMQLDNLNQAITVINAKLR